MSHSDRIEKRVVLRAPRERVWRAIANAGEFGTWFGVELDAPFTAGAIVPARIVPTQMDAEVAKAQEAYAGMPFEIKVERVEPESLLSFRWCPYDPGGETDISGLPTTLVEFVLDDHPDGTLLTITESGFDAIPVDKRAQALTSNDEGWTIQARLIGKYLEQAA
jgi:uncharacterized protein YndB with AHSA1/START domain